MAIFLPLPEKAGDGPSHRIQSTSPVNSFTISSAVLQRPGFPERLADVPVIAPPAALASVRATGWSGTRRPTVPVPPVTASGRPGAAGGTLVSAPAHTAPTR